MWLLNILFKLILEQFMEEKYHNEGYNFSSSFPAHFAVFITQAWRENLKLISVYSPAFPSCPA